MPKLNLACFDDQPVLKTERLTLRALSEQDSKEIFEMRRSSMVSSFIYRPLMEDIGEMDELYEKFRETFEKKETIGWSAMLRNEPKMIGTVGIIRIDHENFRAEIGGEMQTTYWGKGLAQEAAREVIRYGFEIMNLYAFEAWMSPDNRGALKIIEDMGFEKEAYFKQKAWRDGFHDMAVYTLTNPHFKED